MSKKVIDNADDLDVCYSRLKSKFLTLHLQLAEEAKRSSEFKTTYKSESGKEIEVTRSPDGKFASKGGGSSSNSDAKTMQERATQKGDSAKLTKDVLSGETGNQVKDSLVATTSDPDVKVGIRKASFSEILGGAGDAMTNASDYISKKLKEVKTATLQQPLGVIVGEIFVASAILGCIAGSAAVAAGATAPFGLGIAFATNYLGLRVGDAVTTEKLKYDKAEKIKKFQTALTDRQIDESFQKLKKEAEERRKLFKAVGDAVDRQLDKAAERAIEKGKADRIEVDGVPILRKGKSYKLPNGSTVTAE